MITEYAIQILEEEISRLNKLIKDYPAQPWIEKRDSIREGVRVMLEYNTNLVREFTVYEERAS